MTFLPLSLTNPSFPFLYCTDTDEFLVRREVAHTGTLGGATEGDDPYRFAVLSPTRGEGAGQTAKKATKKAAADSSEVPPKKDKEEADEEIGSATVSSIDDGRPPLVVFDKTDPEWDEDSDPDGDLDL